MEIDKISKMIQERHVSIYEECLKTIEKVQFGYELDKWDKANLDTMEMVVKRIVGYLNGNR